MGFYPTISFLTGFSLMVVELSASRILSPLVGGSVYTWTSVIGTVFLGMTIGNIIGGILADKKGDRNFLAHLCIISALLVSFIPFLSRNSEWIVMMDIGLAAKIFLVSFFIFFLPSISFGMIYPAIMKLYLENIKTTGVRSGKISALWSLGGIAGTFLTGFFFIGHIGTSKTILLMSAIMLACYLSARTILGFKEIFLTILITAIILFSFYKLSLPKNSDKLIYYGESDYYSIKVGDVDRFKGKPLRFLVLDFDLHSLEGDGYEEHYPHIYPVFSLFKDDFKKIAVLGGGSNLLSKNMAGFYKNAEIKNIEIDPAVSNVAEKYFKKSPRPIEMVFSDGRMFLKNDTESYDLIFVDVYNSLLSIPWHMTTYEFNETLKKRLSPDGIFALNLISALEGENSAPFQSVFRTIQESFSNIYLFAYDNNKKNVQNIVILASSSKNPPDRQKLLEKMKKTEETRRFSSKFLVENPAVNPAAPLLTDDFAPIERLASKMLSTSFQKHAEFYYAQF